MVPGSCLDVDAGLVASIQRPQRLSRRGRRHDATEGAGDIWPIFIDISGLLALRSQVDTCAEGGVLHE